MAPSKNYPLGLRFAVTVILIFSITIQSSRSVGRGTSSYSQNLQRRNLVLGSRPPGCVNKCMSCRPCKATLVRTSNQMKGYKESSHGEDDSYYLLHWKCRCADKLFQP